MACSGPRLERVDDVVGEEVEDVGQSLALLAIPPNCVQPFSTFAVGVDREEGRVQQAVELERVLAEAMQEVVEAELVKLSLEERPRPPHVVVHSVYEVLQQSSERRLPHHGEEVVGLASEPEGFGPS